MPSTRGTRNPARNLPPNPPSLGRWLRNLSRHLGVGRPRPFNNWNSRLRAGGTNRSPNGLAIPLRARWALGDHATSSVPEARGSPQFHDKNSTASACSRGPFQWENGHPSDPSRMAYGLGPCITQEETAVPCVFIPVELYYSSLNDQTRLLCDAGEMYGSAASGTRRK